ncbi:MAG: RNA polymerase sigma factor [Microgenomates group bacterium]
MRKKEIFSRYLINRLYQFIYWRTKNKDDAEEILQETLKNAWQCLSLYSKKSSFFTWLCGIAKHEIADYYRKKKIKTILFSWFPWLENLVSEALGPEQEFLKKEFLKRVNETFNQLSEGYREVLRLKYIEGLTVKEIAQKLNETVKAIESRLFRARKAFTKAFAANYS